MKPENKELKEQISRMPRKDCPERTGLLYWGQDRRKKYK